MNGNSTDITRLLAEFEAGRFLRPNSSVLNVVDLALAVSARLGVEGVEDSPGRSQIESLIGNPRHLVFLVIDGLGTHFVDDLPTGSFSRSNLTRRILAPWPSTTSVTMTTFATGTWPAHHAVTSWFTHIPQIKDVAAILPFIRRRDSRPLERFGLSVDDVFPAPVLSIPASADPAAVMPDDIVSSVYTRYQSRGSRRISYPRENPAAAIDLVLDRISHALTPTYTFVYVPMLDSLAHKFGVGHDNTIRLLRSIDAELDRLANDKPSDARIVVSADHGHLDVPRDGAVYIEPDDDLYTLLRVPPAQDARVMFFHVKAGEEERFVRRFRERHGDRFALISTGELENLSLMGDEPLAPLTRRRVGDFTAISLGDWAINAGFERDGYPLLSAHSGFTVAEMEIPLIVA